MGFRVYILVVVVVVVVVVGGGVCVCVFLGGSSWRASFIGKDLC